MLSDVVCRKAQTQAKPYKIADSGGLYLLVKANGKKHWRLKYRFLGKEKLLALGTYPLFSLGEAREAREAAKKLLATRIDPVSRKHEEKRGAILDAQNTFKAVALEWYGKKQKSWSPKHGLYVMRRLEVDLFPYLESRPINAIDAPELLDILRKIEKRGSLELVSKVKQICSGLFRYGIAIGVCKRDIAADLRGALETRKAKHYPSLPIVEMPGFLAALERNDARLYMRTRRALKLLMFTFVRTAELIEATWSEFDMDNAQWVIRAERMKTRQAHIVPLSRQALALLEEQREETGYLNTPWVFPSQVRPKDHMSNGTFLSAIAALGYRGKMTGHGFRALAMSTIKEKLGYRHEVVDRQLAHQHQSKIDRAYDRAQFLDQRETMMQEYADYIDSIASGKATGKIRTVKAT